MLVEINGTFFFFFFKRRTLFTSVLHHLVFFYLTTLCVMWDLSSLIGDRTRAPCSGSAEF